VAGIESQAKATSLGEIKSTLTRNLSFGNEALGGGSSTPDAADDVVACHGWGAATSTQSCLVFSRPELAFF
jgi:hypothetical protein